MEIALALHHIWRRKLWLVPVSLIAVIAGLAVAYHLSLFPPALESRSFSYGAANTQVLVDSSDSSLAELSTPISGVAERAGLYAVLLNTQPVKKQIGKLAHVPWREITVTGEASAPGEPNASQGASQIISANEALALFYSVRAGQPIINLSAQAPTAEQARRIASGAVTSLQQYVTTLERRRHVPAARQVDFQQLGVPETGTLAAGSEKVVGLVVMIFVFGFGCLVIVLMPRFLLDFRKAKAVEYGAFPPMPAAPAPAAANGELASASRSALDPVPEQHLDRA